MQSPSEPAPEHLYCLSVPSLPKAFDSVMLGLAKECLRKFKYIIIDGWQPNGFAAHLAFGLAYHKALETYDHDRALGASFEEAQINALNFCLNYGTRDEHGHFQPYDAMYTREPSKTRDTLLRSVVWYLEAFKNDVLKTFILKSGKPAVELSFKLNLDLHTPDGEPFMLAGHLDRLVTLNDDFYFTDRKTTKTSITPRFWNQFTPNNQMSLYYTAGQSVLSEPIKGGIIDAVEIGATYCRFKRHTITRTRGQQEEWLNETYYWIGVVQQCATDDHWPMNDKSCGNFGGCPFQIVCARDPKVRDEFLKHEGYHKREWNPLVAR